VILDAELAGARLEPPEDAAPLGQTQVGGATELALIFLGDEVESDASGLRRLRVVKNERRLGICRR
jgi:hypothetical protein